MLNIHAVSELPAGQGFNAATLTYGDLAADGIVDPVKVTRSAVLNAASVARMVLTTETAVVEKPAEKADDGNGHHGQDIRPPTCIEDARWEAVAVEAGIITSVTKNTTVTLKGDGGTE